MNVKVVDVNIQDPTGLSRKICVNDGETLKTLKEKYFHSSVECTNAAFFYHGRILIDESILDSSFFKVLSLSLCHFDR